MNTTLTPPSSPATQSERRSDLPRPVTADISQSRWRALLPRVFLAGMLALATVLSMAQFGTPGVVPATAPATEFSAERAMRDVAVIAQEPHPMGTPAHAAVERYLLQRLRAMGLHPQVSSMTATLKVSDGVVYAGRARQIVARIPGTANTGAVLLAGHYDTVPTGPGAADCTACVATVLETVRALKAGPTLRNDIIVLLADAEEHDTLGAKGFMDQHPWAKDIRLALNIDSMGNNGPATAYFASRDNRWLMTEYFNVAPYPLSYSFFVDPFSRANQGMDLKNYVRNGALGIDAANFRNPQVYHTALDNPKNLNGGTLQHEGSNFLALARHFAGINLGTVPHTGDAVFFNVTADRGIIYPAEWALPIAIVVTILFVDVVVLGLRRRKLTPGGLLVGFGAFIGAFLASTVAIGLAWWAIKSATPDYRVFMQDTPYGNDVHVLAFAALALAVTATIYAATRKRVGAHDLALGAVALCVVVALLLSAFLPGMSYVVVWPTLATLVVLGWMALSPREWGDWASAVALAVTGGVTLILVSSVVYFLFEYAGRAELTSSIPIAEVALVPGILLLALFLTHLEFLGAGRRWIVPAVALLASIGFFAGGRVTSGFDATHPRPDSVAYVMNADTGRASWVSVGEGTDNWTRQFFPHGSQKTTFAAMPSEMPDLKFPALRTAAPVAALPVPRVTILSDRTNAGVRRLELLVRSPRSAPNAEVKVTADGRLAGASVDGRPVSLGASAAGTPGRLRLEYYGVPRSGFHLTLRLSPHQRVDLTVSDRSNGLPAIPGMTIKPRPAGLMPAMFEMRDPTIITRTFTLSR